MTNSGMLPASMWTPGQLDLKVDDADSHLAHHQTIRAMSVCELIKSSLNHYYKTCHYLPQVGTLGFEGISLLCPTLPGKTIKLFFSTSLQTWSPRFDMAQMYREAELSALSLRTPRIIQLQMEENPNRGDSEKKQYMCVLGRRVVSCPV